MGWHGLDYNPKTLFFLFSLQSEWFHVKVSRALEAETGFSVPLLLKFNNSLTTLGQ